MNEGYVKCFFIKIFSGYEPLCFDFGLFPLISFLLELQITNGLGFNCKRREIYYIIPNVFISIVDCTYLVWPGTLNDLDC